jgi:hypothetical protein
MQDENNGQESTDSVAARIGANLDAAERRIQGSVCPIYVIDAREKPKLLGSSVPFRVAQRAFLLTAAHVLDENKQTNLYVAGPEKLIALEGSSHRVCAPLGDRQSDTFDFGFIEVTSTPEEQWSRYTFNTPEDLDVDDVGAEHTLYGFVGFPASKNKGLIGRKLRLSTTAMILTPTPQARYKSMALDPLAHFAGNFNRNKQLDATKAIVVGPDPHGISGGGVWRLGKPAEFANGTNAERLIGIGIEYRSARAALIAARISLVMAAFATAYPDLSGSIPRTTLGRITVTMNDRASRQ